MVKKENALMRNSSNHIKFIQMISRNDHTFFNIVVPYVLPQQVNQEKSKILYLSSVTSGSNLGATRVWFLSHLRKRFACFSPLMARQ